MSIQPYTSAQRLIVEARNPDGSLRFDCEQPPERYADTTIDALYQDMFREHPNAVGIWPALSAWLLSKSWTVRPRNW